MELSLEEKEEVLKLLKEEDLSKALKHLVKTKDISFYEASLLIKKLREEV